jgi:hypothetical protein
METALFGTIRNVSSAGIALSTSRSFDPGTELVIELSAKRKSVLRLPVRVVHATPEKEGRWVIGCAFIVPRAGDEERRTYQPSAS